MQSQRFDAFSSQFAIQQCLILSKQLHNKVFVTAEIVKKIRDLKRPVPQPQSFLLHRSIHYLIGIVEHYPYEDVVIPNA